MASKKKTETIISDEIKNEEEVIKNEEKSKKLVEKVVVEPKYKVGSIVYIKKDADADLNGFKLFPQYKKYAYTVEAYDDDTGVFTLRRLNLSLSLKEDAIVSPDERAHDQINRMQF